MNRAKQLEALRGMKFMQRKEEEMRRELAEGSTSTETAVTTETSDRSAAANIPATTILIEDRFDPSSHAMGRKRFGQRAPQPIVPAAAPAEAFDEGGLWQALPEIVTSSSTSGNVVSMNEPMDEEGAGAGKQYRGSGRFTLKESVRAPPMPRRLEESMGGPDRKRGRAEGNKKMLNSYEGEGGDGDAFEV